MGVTHKAIEALTRLNSTYQTPRITLAEHEFKMEAVRWCWDNVGTFEIDWTSHRYADGRTVFCIADHEKAMLFKLTFG